MYLIVNKDNNVVRGYGENLHYWDNGYPILTDENIAFVKEEVDVITIETVPEEVVPYQYCYTEKDGFYKNPNWVEPDPTNTYGIPDDIYHAIIDQHTA